MGGGGGGGVGGGWGKRGTGVPLAQRVRAGRAAPAPQPDAPSDDCPARHCWVTEAVDGLGVKRPGLLVEWRAAGTRWEGRVVYAARLRHGAWVLVEEWVPAELLTPC
ncbi:hypothetical protein GCM10027448_34310 [Nocardioides dilutus]